MTELVDDDVTLGCGLQPGDHHYRAFIDFPSRYDIGVPMQFSLLAALGLRLAGVVPRTPYLDIGTRGQRRPSFLEESG